MAPPWAILDRYFEMTNNPVPIPIVKRLTVTEEASAVAGHSSKRARSMHADANCAVKSLYFCTATNMSPRQETGGFLIKKLCTAGKSIQIPKMLGVFKSGNSKLTNCNW